MRASEQLSLWSAPVLHKRNQGGEKPAHFIQRVAPAHHSQLEKAQARQQRPGAAERKEIKNLKDPY